MDQSSRDAWGAPRAVFHGLSGAWRFRREIAGLAVMEGEAAFTTIDRAALLYHERGTLELGTGQSLEAERRYLFRATAEGFDVFFAEPPNGLFHTIALNRTGQSRFGEAPHVCGDDLYRSRYAFEPDGHFSIRHEVRGPRKDYVSVTVFRRGC